MRDSRHTHLTDAGQTLLADARDALEATERLRRRAGLAAGGSGGRVAVGFLWSTLTRYLPALVAAGAERHPEIELSVAQLRYVDVIPALRRGDVDLTITRIIQADSEMIARVLRTEPSLLAIPAAHPLADQDVVTVAALDGMPLIALSRSSVGRAFDMVLDRLADAGVRPRLVHEATSPSEALALVSAGRGLYQLPGGAAVSMPGVVYRPLEGIVSRIVLMRRPEPPPPPVRAIAELAAELFGDAADASNDGAHGLDRPPDRP